jgi:hypothetical protein
MLSKLLNIFSNNFTYLKKVLIKKPRQKPGFTHINHYKTELKTANFTNSLFLYVFTLPFSAIKNNPSSYRS